MSERQNGQRRYISWRVAQLAGTRLEELGDGAAESVPARQRMPALHPAKDQGNGAEVVDLGRPAPPARPGADLELRDLLDRRGLREIGQ